MMFEHVLVTGATGFVGAPLVARLAAEGAKVTALARSFEGRSLPPGVEPFAVDLTQERDALRALHPFRWDAVVHLAGPVPKGVEPLQQGMRTAEAHVHLALFLLRALPPGFRGRIVYTSSMTVYGLPLSLPVSEDAPRRPFHLYAFGKSLADDVFLHHREPLDLWLLRLPGLFSPSRKGGALYHFARAASAGEPLHVTAKEPIAWDILDVRDAVEAICRALQSDICAPGPLNISYGEPVEIVSMARRIAALGGKGSTVNAPEGVTHPVFQLDIRRARSALGWPPVSLDERLRELIASVSNPPPEPH